MKFHSLNDICLAVSSYTNVSQTKIKSESVSKKLKRPRTLLCHIAFEVGHTQDEISSYIGGRHRSYACRLLSKLPDTQDLIEVNKLLTP